MAILSVSVCLVAPSDIHVLLLLTSVEYSPVLSNRSVLKLLLRVSPGVFTADGLMRQCSAVPLNAVNMSKATKHAIDTSDMDCDNSRFIYLKKILWREVRIRRLWLRTAQEKNQDARMEIREKRNS